MNIYSCSSVCASIPDNLSRETTIREKKQRHQQKSKSSKSRPSGVEGEEREDWQSLVRVADLLPVDDNHLLNRYQHQQPPVHHHHHIHQLHHHHHHHHPGGRGGGGGGTDQPVYSQHHAHQVCFCFVNATCSAGCPANTRHWPNVVLTSKTEGQHQNNIGSIPPICWLD